jgi:hypothetical protein
MNPFNKIITSIAILVWFIICFYIIGVTIFGILIVPLLVSIYIEIKIENTKK